MEQRSIAVVGAGAVGLSTAVQLQQFLQSSSLSAASNVSLIADRFTTDTTSHGAAGIFRPSPDKFPGVPLTQLRLAFHQFSSVQFSILANVAIRKISQVSSLRSKCLLKPKSEM